MRFAKVSNTRSRLRPFASLLCTLALFSTIATSIPVTLVRAAVDEQQPKTAAIKRPLTHKDYDSWRSIQSSQISRDGRFVAYAYMPQDGDGEIVVRTVGSTTEWRAPRGYRPPVPPPDDPGANLGVSKLVHVAEPADLSQLNNPELVQVPPDIKLPMQLPLAFQPISGNDNDTGNTYIADSPLSETGHIHMGDVNDKIMVNYYGKRVTPPVGYELSEVNLKSVAGNHWVDPVFFNITATSFDVHLRGAYFPIEGRLSLEVELVFKLSKAERDKIDTTNESIKRENNNDKQRKIKEAYVKYV